MRATLKSLSTASDCAAIAGQLTHFVTLLLRNPPAVPNHLVQTYRWLIAKAEVLRDLSVHRPSSRLVRLVNEFAEDLLHGFDGASRHALHRAGRFAGELSVPGSSHAPRVLPHVPSVSAGAAAVAPCPGQVHGRTV